MNTGSFDVGGRVPDIKDERASFIKGLFHHTLTSFLKVQSFTSSIVIHNDSDLYLSTLYILTRCHDILVPGSIIIFDEFSSILHEFHALEDYCSSYLNNYDVLGATKTPDDYYSQIAIQIK